MQSFYLDPCLYDSGRKQPAITIDSWYSAGMSVPPSDNTGQEHERLTALARLQILDTPAEEVFDQITRVAALALGAHHSAVTLIDDRRAWFKSRHALSIGEIGRDESFCTHTLSSRDLLVVPDLTADPRFENHPMVRGGLGLRFYAGAPLVSADGHHLGALCVLDTRRRAGLSVGERQILRGLAATTVQLIETRRLRTIGVIATQVFDHALDAVIFTAEDGTIVFANGPAAALVGLPHAELPGRAITELFPAWAEMTRLLAGGARDVSAANPEARHASGRMIPVRATLGRVGVADRLGYATIVQDASAQRALERESRAAQDLLETVIEQLPAMLFVKDSVTGQYLLVNRAGEVMSGVPRERLIGRTATQLYSELGAAYEEQDQDALAHPGEARTFENEFIRPDGERITLRTTRIVLDGPARDAQYVVGLSEDVSEERRAKAEILRLAHFDALTGLVNRRSYLDRLDELLASGTALALLAVDLDRFRSVNDLFGHVTGDFVLAAVGERLRALAGPLDVVARVGGDEFVLLVVGDDPVRRGQAIAAAAVTALSQPIAAPIGTAHLGASIGIVLAPDHAAETAALRHCGDLALYDAKARGRGAISVYDPAMDAAARDRRALEVDLRAAIERGEIGLLYQPVLTVDSGSIGSAEALARWTHPTRGPIKPDLFIAIAEESGLIVPLGRMLLRQACFDAATWPEHLSVAVNLSPVQFHAGDVQDTVVAALADSGLSPHRLKLEVTENVVIHDVERTFVALERLRATGIKILMDDFGTGYSSLGYFRRFPFDEVKIDQSFVHELETSPAATAIIRAIVGLGEALGMAIVAEGVETCAQRDALVLAGCTHLQGYLFSRPVSSASIAALEASGLFDRVVL